MRFQDNQIRPISLFLTRTYYKFEGLDFLQRSTKSKPARSTQNKAMNWFIQLCTSCYNGSIGEKETHILINSLFNLVDDSFFQKLVNAGIIVDLHPHLTKVRNYG